MRIAIVVETFPSVSETFISNKVKGLIAKGHFVIVFCSKENDALLNNLFSNEDNLKVVLLNRKNLIFFVLRHPLRIFFNYYKEYSFNSNLFRQFNVSTINKSLPDIIHFEFSGIGIYYLSELNYLKGKKVVSCRGSGEKVKLLVEDNRKKKFSQLLNAIDAVHCVSKDMYDTILPYSADHKKIFINYPSIDTGFFKSNSSAKANTCMILSVGRLTFQKGYATGLLAVNCLKKSGIIFNWVIVGSGPLRDEIIFQINHLGLQDHVVLLGSKSVSEIKGLLQQAHVFFLPSVYEGIANVVLEAMSMELPVVSTRCGGMQEVITHGENGLLSDVYDYVGLSNNLLQLLSNESLQKNLGKAARQTIIRNFDINFQINKFESIYTYLKSEEQTKIISRPVLHSGRQSAVKLQKKEKEVKAFKDKVLHIGIVIPQFLFYTETFFESQILGLLAKGNYITVFCNYRPGDKNSEELFILERHLNLKVVVLNFNSSVFKIATSVLKHPLIFFQSFHFRFSSFRKKIYLNLSKFYFNKACCDIYHFGYSGVAISYSPIFKNLIGKTMVSCLGTAENIKPLSEEGRIEKLRNVFEKVDKIHCVSGKMAQTVKNYGAAGEKIYINRPAVDVNFFARQGKYVESNKINILSIGRLVFQKGFVIGILAINDLRSRYDNFIWKIVGEGPEREELLSHIHALGLQDFIQLVGKKTRNEVFELYQTTDIFFLPSVSEGIANVVLEAMAMKLPVVSSKNGGMEEVIEHEVNGLLCENYDHQSLAMQLSCLCTNFEKRKQLGEAARKTIEEKFSLKRYIDVFEQEYHKLIEA